MTKSGGGDTTEPMISYAQNFEDVILARIFREQEVGFYIDIGVWDATKDSVTKHFYDIGWSGINVEPLIENYRRIAAARPRDINLNVAVSSHIGPLQFFSVGDTGLSTTCPGYASAHAAAGFDVKALGVPATSLENIFVNHARDRVVDFLKIDVEGAESDVVCSGNWTRFRPRVVVIEATIPNSPVESYSDWEPRLTTSGYEFCYFDGLNRWYIREEERELRQHFASPPNVFDHFVHRPFHQLQQENKLLREKLESAMKKADQFDKLARNILGKILIRLG